MATVKELEQIAKRLSIHSLKMTAESNSGHPTTCMSIAEIMSCLFFNEMEYDVNEPNGYNNDEFILSKGHAAPILWACYAEAGIVVESELFNLRKLTCPLEGHPTPRMPWIKSATGSLGQGLSTGVGLALATRLDKSDRRVYVILGDGECAEGSVWEAANSASYYKLNNLCAVVDVNRLGQSAATMHGHDIDAYANKFKAFGWNAVTIDGHKVEEILKAFENARGSDKPTAIIAKTYKGNGVSFLQDQDGWHGKPVTGDKLNEALKEIGEMPEINAKEFVKKPEKKVAPTYKTEFALNNIEYAPDKPVATREAYGHALVMLGEINDKIVGVDADVKNSTNEQGFADKYSNRSFDSFIAEQNMVGIATGFAGRGFFPFAATFACFLTRAHDQIRMAAYSESNIKLAGSHVGVSIGPDGASQMGLEDLAMFRPIPGCLIFYPSDAYSAAACTAIMAGHEGVSYIRTSRPKTPILYTKDDKFEIGGSKIVQESASDKVTIVAAGVTVHNAIEASKKLGADGINVRIVDAYSVKPIDAKGINAAVTATNDKLIVVEDHFEEGGLGEAVKSVLENKVDMLHLCVRELPHSGEPEELMERYGVGTNCIVDAVKKLV